MPRRARLDAPGTLHHVIVRGIEKGPIVADDADRDAFVLRLGRLAVETQTAVYAWALMSNHAHLLLKTSRYGLPGFMRRLLTGHAITYNLRHQRHGHLFQNRYKSIVCEEDAYFRELVRYIHLNPMRAGLVASLNELEAYPWSGHTVLIGKTAKDWQQRKYVLSCFGRKKAAAIAAYRTYVQAGVATGHRPQLVGGGLIRSAGGWSAVKAQRREGILEKGDERILGSSDFVLQVVNAAEHRLRYQFSLGERIEKAEQLLARECRKAGVTSQALKAGGRRRATSRVRKKLAQQFVEELGLSLAEAGRLLGVSTSAIARTLQRNNKL
jgi:REP element-mobilizing transposase RayT